MINIAELINDPDFAQVFKIIRKSGEWINGRFIITETILEGIGSLQPQNSKDVDVLPDGSLVRGRMVAYTYSKLYPTKLNNDDGNTGYSSDEIFWHGQTYTVDVDDDYNDYGYYKYICQIKQAANNEVDVP